MISSTLPNPSAPQKNVSFLAKQVCTENIGSLLADLGQLNTYLFGAASGCGETTLVPFAPFGQHMGCWGWYMGFVQREQGHHVKVISHYRSTIKVEGHSQSSYNLMSLLILHSICLLLLTHFCFDKHTF